ncbi:glutathione S-transferase family protein [Alphaproteobacteria bacterium]|nr:glutathione S-transferase family protein [Alphaproteobacteria bacterium]
MIIFYCVPTPNGQKIAILLEEMKLTYKLLMQERKVGEPPNLDYLEINPIGKYPSIVDKISPEGKEITLFETHAIALYLVEKTKLMVPSNEEERSNSHIWASVISSGLTPLMGTQYFIQFRSGEYETKISSWILEEAIRYLSAIDFRLSNNKYLAGDSLSYADCLAFPILNISARRLPEGINHYQNIKEWISELSKRPAFIEGVKLTKNN